MHCGIEDQIIFQIFINGNESATDYVVGKLTMAKLIDENSMWAYQYSSQYHQAL